MASQTLKIEISVIRIDPWIVEDRSLGVNKTKNLVQKHKYRSFDLQGSIPWKRIIFGEYSSPMIDPLIEKIDTFIFVTAFSKFLRFGISIFAPKIDHFLSMIDSQESDFTLSL